MAIILDHTTGTISVGGNGVLTLSGVPTATSSVSGFFSAIDKAKLDTIASGAEANTVDSVFGRTGAITATSGDYDASLITFTPTGNIAATTVSGALAELDSEKAPLTGATFTSSAFNGTVGATTPSTGAFTTVSATGSITAASNIISNTAPELRFLETDQTLPAGLFRFNLESNVFRLQRNAAVAGDFSSATSIIAIDTSNRLIVGGVSASGTTMAGIASTFQAIGSTANTASIAIYKTGNNSVSPTLSLGASRDGIVQNNDPLGTLIFSGNDGSNTISGATITALVDGNPDTNDMPTRLEFAVSPDGSATPVVALSILNSGLVQVNTSSNSFTLPNGRGTNGYVLTTDGAGGTSWTTKSSVVIPIAVQVAASDEVTPLTTGTAKVTFRIPANMTITSINASLTTASSSGTVTVDVNKTGVGSLFSVPISISSGNKTSVGSGTPTLSTTTLSFNDEITVDIDAAGTNATGLKVNIIGEYL